MKTTIQLLHDPDQNNVDNLNNVRRVASRHRRNKRKKGKFDELEYNSKNKTIRGLYKRTGDFRKGYQQRTIE